MIYPFKLDPVVYLSLSLKPRSQAISMTGTPSMRMGCFEGHRGCQEKVETSPVCCWSCRWGETYDSQPKQSQLCNPLGLTALWWHDTVSGWRNHDLCVAPCPISEEKGFATRWPFLLQSHEQPQRWPRRLGWAEIPKRSGRAEIVMLRISFREAEKREWEQEKIYRTFLLLFFCLDSCQAHLGKERGNVVSTRWNFEWVQAVSKETCSIIVEEITSWIICGLGR